MQNFLSNTLNALASSVIPFPSKQPPILGELPDELSGAGGKGWSRRADKLALLRLWLDDELGVCDIVDGAYDVFLEDACTDVVSECALRGGETLRDLAGGVVVLLCVGAEKVLVFMTAWAAAACRCWDLGESIAREVGY